MGTMCELVTLYCSMSWSISSGTHLSMSTTVWPEVDGGAREAQDGGVVERRADDVDVVVVGLDAEQEEDPGQAEGRLLGGGPAQLAGTPPWGCRWSPRCSS